MIVVIPCAGNSQRFVDAGYDVPKPLLPIGSKTMIEHVVTSLPHCEMIVTIAKWTLALKPEMFSSRAWYPINIKRKTNGPLDTLWEARTLMKNNDELLIHYCDLWLPDDQCTEFVEEMRNKKRHAGVVCFPSTDERFQREPSGKYAMSGVFWFKQAKEFVELATGYHDDPHLSPGHLAFAVRWMGLSMASAFVTNDIVDLGEPKTYEIYKALQSAKTIEAGTPGAT